MPVKTFLGVIATALGAAASLVLIGACDGPPEIDRPPFEARASAPAFDDGDECFVCQMFAFDPEIDDD